MASDELPGPDADKCLEILRMSERVIRDVADLTLLDGAAAVDDAENLEESLAEYSGGSKPDWNNDGFSEITQTS